MDMQFLVTIALAAFGSIAIGATFVAGFYIATRFKIDPSCVKNHEWRAKGLAGPQLDALVRSQGRIHCGDCELHPFIQMKDDAIRCGTCQGVLV